MKEFEVQERSDNDYTVTDKDSGDVYNVHLSHYGSPEINRVSSGGGGSLLGLFAILWIASIIGMPIIFFTEKIYLYESAPVLYIIAYLCSLVSFIFTAFPEVKKYKNEKLKKYSLMFIYIFNYILLVFSALVYFTQSKENSIFIFIYIMPLVGYLTIIYHIKDSHLIYPMMKTLKIKRYSFTGVYLVQWLIIAVIFYFLIMEPFGKVLGDFLMFIICYMYMILVDVKKLWLRKVFIS